jgi:hypothetical protein
MAMVFVFKCKVCGARAEVPSRDAPICCEAQMVRDYRAEGVGLGSGVRASREPNIHEQAALFLPTNDDFKGPGDPDGTKGMRAWREAHGPREGNKKPYWPGEVEKKVF